MTADSLHALGEKFRKQTEDGINAMLRANVDPKSELATLIESLRSGEAANAMTAEPFRLAHWVVDVSVHPIRDGLSEARIAG